MEPLTPSKNQTFILKRPATYWFDDLGKRYLLEQGTKLKFLYCFRMLDCWLVVRTDETLMFICQMTEKDISLTE